ncbi:helix-turn-helix transcriptional regulator [Paenibacillus aceti]|uniref:helix-turn-helix transcriptional regulator n=1 Tax=Paenibacillus aceti TaxID=1820010 RepID=UPI000EA36357|nr:AraC family transcriptional regulator [Paenibacillus aceti]
MGEAWNTGASVDFERIMGSRDLRVFQERIGPAVSFLLKRFASAIDKPGASNLELECHALEIFMLACRLFLKEGEESSRAVALSRDEMEKLQEAKRIMKERLIDPPTLLELSRLIGLNDYKLKVGFKELYGTTVFGYLKDERLKQALLMLQTGRVNVGEAACAVGYLNPSYRHVFRQKTVRYLERRPI